MKISQYRFMLYLSLFFALFYNFSFFKNVVKVYGFSGENIFYIASVFVVLVASCTLVLSLLTSRKTAKVMAIALLLISSMSAYFMDTYSVVIDSDMIRNVVQTNPNEAFDLVSYKLFIYLFLLGILPSIFVYKLRIEYGSFKKESLKKLGYVFASLLVIVAVMLPSSRFFSSFLREHKPLRYSANPTYWLYSIGKFSSHSFSSGKLELKKQALDAKIDEPKDDKKELTILVVGEAVRADRFSLNGYKRDTNPLLSKQNDLINFSNMYSCGTSTAVSVPCMFSMFDRDDYSYKKGRSNENILDILQRVGVNVLWRDNNSDSKGVALRVPYQNFKTSKLNPVCDNGECRDIGMLSGLDKYIKKGRDNLIILHMMGNHGPAYYKRYPKEFEKFKPVCKTNQLENCTKEQINNAYDNAVLYSDYFLSKTIEFLKPYQKEFATSMIYISDHGESLGENGVYLHGMPYFFAPNSQKHVASFMWLGSLKDEVNFQKLSAKKDKSLSQDYLFNTLLDLYEVKTSLYNKKLDLFR